MTKQKQKSPPQPLAKEEEMEAMDDEPMEDEYEDKGYYKSLERTNRLLGRVVKAVESVHNRVAALESVPAAPPAPVTQKGEDEEEDEEDDMDTEKMYKAVLEQNKLLKALLSDKKVRKDYPIEEIDLQEADTDHYEEDTVDEETSPTATTRPTDPHDAETGDAFVKASQVDAIVKQAVTAALKTKTAPAEKRPAARTQTPRPVPVRKSAPAAAPSDSPFDEELMLKAVAEDRKVKGHRPSGKKHMAAFMKELKHSG